MRLEKRDMRNIERPQMENGDVLARLQGVEAKPIKCCHLNLKSESRSVTLTSTRSNKQTSLIHELDF